ncbi:hypothetical protein JAAARDRAFT_615232 [Jaapia argillacea MUCL 33604]|uniref:Uncharacterized protein n=1 Tax=Jaapia argillacea MUCL 33604 TaxID=933084 RepID=A0A067P7D2_9AGAM|nr:hypothetical protein JAAARDRAFT_615232 [Jaapia argillacea MUCL 33604]
MTGHLSKLESLCTEILSNIAFHLGTIEPLGPPSDLISFLLCSTKIYSSLALSNNYDLYARIFTCKFDISALPRRFPSRWATNKCLALELKKRFLALGRIKIGQLASREQLVDDLWTVYLAWLENDGQNESQLLKWAELSKYLKHVIGASIRMGIFQWFVDSEPTALVVWLLWMTTDQDELASESQGFRLDFQRLLQPFIIAGFRHPSFHAPDEFFSLPLCPHTYPPDPSSPSYSSAGIPELPPSSPPRDRPVVRQIIHYSHPLTLSSPPLTAAALLASVSRTETQLRLDYQSDGYADWKANRRRQLSNHPQTRAERDALGLMCPSMEDLDDFETSSSVTFAQRLSETPTAGTEKESSDFGSQRFDEDWYRLVSCFDPWGDEPPLRGKVFSPGTMAGRWRGRLLVPSISHFITHAIQTSNPALVSTVPIYHHEVSFTLREHHCLEPNIPLPVGADEWAHDVLNAWFPADTIITTLKDAIEISAPSAGVQTRYETCSPHYPDTPPYLSKVTYPKSYDELDNTNAAPMEEYATDTIPAEDMAYIDDDGWDDTVEHVSSGITDIILTGETDKQHGNAWGHFTFVGRVRPWDGLVALLRTPVRLFYHLCRLFHIN